MPEFYRRVKHASTMDSMSHNARIEAAIAELKSQKRINYAEIARKWKLTDTTLRRRFIGKTTSIQEANTESRQKLTSIQEEALIEHANKLTDRGIPPTPQILKNIAEEISKTKLGPNWVARFCKRHSHRLTSVYLRAIDYKRKVADNSRYFRKFFDLVSNYPGSTVVVLWWLLAFKLLD